MPIRGPTSRSCCHLYRQGDLILDELITQTYTLDQVNEGYEAYASAPGHPRDDHVRLSRLVLDTGPEEGATYPQSAVAVAAVPRRVGS